MAWPLSRLIDFVAESVPQITDTFLNAVQDGVIALANGTQSVKALVVDGIGGISVVPTDGWIYGKVLRLSQAIGSTAGQTGELWSDHIPFATAIVTSMAGLVRGSNVASVARTAGQPAGYFDVTLRSCPLAWSGLADGTTVHLPLAFGLRGMGAWRMSARSTKETVGGAAVIVVTVLISDLAGNPADEGFYLIVFP